MSPVNQDIRFNRLQVINTALSSEKDLNKLLELIVNGAQELTHADGATLYILDNKNEYLHFKIVANTTLKIWMGASHSQITWPPLPMKIGKYPNLASVSTAAATIGEVIDVADVYKCNRFDFTGTKEFDSRTGYKSQSMIVVPLKDHLDNVIGVLQLLNALDDNNKVIAFNKEDKKLIEAMASQAAVAINNTQLVADLKNFLYSFISSISNAIDVKSAFQTGHVRRVTKIACMIAKKISNIKTGPFKTYKFNQQQLEEIRIAGQLHDIGKIITPDHILCKATKLETILDGAETINLRFEILKRDREIAALKKALGKNIIVDVSDIEENQNFVMNANTGSEFMSKEDQAKIDQIAKIPCTINNKTQPLLAQWECENLKIAKGTLNNQERQIIQDHVVHSIEMLEELPFPKDLCHVPEIAGSHHEKLDGSGYPKGKSKKDLSLAARIMAVADIFEALTAKDRPYKQPMSLNQALKIMGLMIKDNHIDGNIFECFINEGVMKQYCQEELSPEQIKDYQW